MKALFKHRLNMMRLDMDLSDSFLQHIFAHFMMIRDQSKFIPSILNECIILASFWIQIPAFKGLEFLSVSKYLLSETFSLVTVVVLLSINVFVLLYLTISLFSLIPKKFRVDKTNLSTQAVEMLAWKPGQCSSQGLGQEDAQNPPTNSVLKLVYVILFRLIFLLIGPFSIGLSFRITVFNKLSFIGTQHFEISPFLVTTLWVASALSVCLMSIYATLGLSKVPNGDHLACFNRKIILLVDLNIIYSQISQPWLINLLRNRNYGFQLVLLFCLRLGLLASSYFYTRKKNLFYSERVSIYIEFGFVGIFTCVIAKMFLNVLYKADPSMTFLVLFVALSLILKLIINCHQTTKICFKKGFSLLFVAKLIQIHLNSVQEYDSSNDDYSLIYLGAKEYVMKAFRRDNIEDVDAILDKLKIKRNDAQQGKKGNTETENEKNYFLETTGKDGSGFKIRSSLNASSQAFSNIKSFQGVKELQNSQRQVETNPIHLNIPLGLQTKDNSDEKEIQLFPDLTFGDLISVLFHFLPSSFEKDYFSLFHNLNYSFSLSQASVLLRKIEAEKCSISRIMDIYCLKAMVDKAIKYTYFNDSFKNVQDSFDFLPRKTLKYVSYLSKKEQERRKHQESLKSNSSKSLKSRPNWRSLITTQNPSKSPNFNHQMTSLSRLTQNPSQMNDFSPEIDDSSEKTGFLDIGAYTYSLLGIAQFHQMLSKAISQRRTVLTYLQHSSNSDPVQLPFLLSHFRSLSKSDTQLEDKFSSLLQSPIGSTASLMFAAYLAHCSNRLWVSRSLLRRSLQVRRNLVGALAEQVGTKSARGLSGLSALAVFDYNSSVSIMCSIGKKLGNIDFCSENWNGVFNTYQVNLLNKNINDLIVPNMREAHMKKMKQLACSNEALIEDYFGKTKKRNVLISPDLNIYQKVYSIVKIFPLISQGIKLNTLLSKNMSSIDNDGFFSDDFYWIISDKGKILGFSDSHDLDVLPFQPEDFLNEQIEEFNSEIATLFEGYLMVEKNLLSNNPSVIKRGEKEIWENVNSTSRGLTTSLCFNEPVTGTTSLKTASTRIYSTLVKMDFFSIDTSEEFVPPGELHNAFRHLCRQQMRIPEAECVSCVLVYLQSDWSFKLRSDSASQAISDREQMSSYSCSNLEEEIKPDFFKKVKEEKELFDEFETAKKANKEENQVNVSDASIIEQGSKEEKIISQNPSKVRFFESPQNSQENLSNLDNHKSPLFKPVAPRNIPMSKNLEKKRPFKFFELPHADSLIQRPKENISKQKSGKFDSVDIQPKEKRRDSHAFETYLSKEAPKDLNPRRLTRLSIVKNLTPAQSPQLFRNAVYRPRGQSNIYNHHNRNMTVKTDSLPSHSKLHKKGKAVVKSKRGDYLNRKDSPHQMTSSLASESPIFSSQTKLLQSPNIQSLFTGEKICFFAVCLLTWGVTLTYSSILSKITVTASTKNIEIRQIRRDEFDVDFYIKESVLLMGERAIFEHHNLDPLDSMLTQMTRPDKFNRFLNRDKKFEYSRILSDASLKRSLDSLDKALLRMKYRFNYQGQFVEPDYDRLPDSWENTVLNAGDIHSDGSFEAEQLSQKMDSFRIVFILRQNLRRWMKYGFDKSPNLPFVKEFYLKLINVWTKHLSEESEQTDLFIQKFLKDLRFNVSLFRSIYISVSIFLVLTFFLILIIIKKKFVKIFKTLQFIRGFEFVYKLALVDETDSLISKLSNIGLSSISNDVTRICEIDWEKYHHLRDKQNLFAQKNRRRVKVSFFYNFGLLPPFLFVAILSAVAFAWNGLTIYKAETQILKMFEVMKVKGDLMRVMFTLQTLDIHYQFFVLSSLGLLGTDWILYPKQLDNIKTIKEKFDNKHQSLSLFIRTKSPDDPDYGFFFHDTCQQVSEDTIKKSRDPSFPGHASPETESILSLETPKLPYQDCRFLADKQATSTFINLLEWTHFILDETNQKLFSHSFSSTYKKDPSLAIFLTSAEFQHHLLNLFLANRFVYKEYSSKAISEGGQNGESREVRLGVNWVWLLGLMALAGLSCRYKVVRLLSVSSNMLLQQVSICTLIDNSYMILLMNKLYKSRH